MRLKIRKRHLLLPEGFQSWFNVSEDLRGLARHMAHTGSPSYSVT